MTLFNPDPRNACAFVGEHEGVRFTCHPHRYGSGMVLQLTRTKQDMWKDRAAWLAEALGGRWARGHQEGYRIARTRAALWHRLFLAGWDATCSCFHRKTDHYPRFHPPGSKERLTFKEMTERIKNP